MKDSRIYHEYNCYIIFGYASYGVQFIPIVCITCDFVDKKKITLLEIIEKYYI